MAIENNNLGDEEASDQAGEQKCDFWSDEGAKRFNEILDEGNAYLAARGGLSVDPEEDPEDEERDYLDPELHHSDEETLPPGEMELIFENSFIM